MMIKELRKESGLTQKEFAATFAIPISTFRKWEQGEASPPAYVLTMIARCIPGKGESYIVINGKDGNKYFYDRFRKQVLDSRGNRISVNADPKDVKEQNFSLYVSDLFQSFYQIKEQFERDCRLDKEENILWI